MFNLIKVNNLVTQYLNGVVTDLKIHYIADNEYRMTISYDGNWFYSYEYQVKINELEETIEHCYHTCQCKFAKIKLPQEIEFEQCISNALKRNVVERVSG